MSVNLRKKTLGTGRISLYLDFYPAIRNPDTGVFTRRQFLKLYLLEKPKTDLERETNRKTYLLAQNICAQRLIEVQNHRFGFLAEERKDGNFIEYFRKLASRKSGSNYFGWKMAWRYLESYGGSGLRFRDLTEEFSEEYRDYMLTGPGIGRYGKRIGSNTAGSYFAKFRTMLKTAYKAKLLDENLYEIVPPIDEQEAIREFLTLEEFRALVKVPIPNCVMRKASIFAVLTGLRFCDIKALKWEQVRGFYGNHYIQFTQEKTESPETFPISDEAFELLGERRYLDDLVFKDLRYSRIKPFLAKWLDLAGVHKSNFTFHCLRHTYATLQLALGTDIFTLMKMLGHKSIKSTMRYLHLLDTQKKGTTEKIKLADIQALINAS
jgi:integrase